MGIYDRDYLREKEPGYHVSVAAWSWTVKIIVFNACIYVVQLIAKPRVGSSGGWIEQTFSIHADWWTHPWMFYQLLTAGFLHSPYDLGHVLCNMLVLWFLGRDLEAKYGPREFVCFYLAAIVCGSLAWSGAQYLWGDPGATGLGASGGVTAVLILFAFNFPRRELLFMMVLPMPAWVVATIAMAYDVHRAFVNPDHIGYQAHLGGAIFALAYYQFGWRVSRFLPYRLAMPSMKRRPKLRVHRPEPAEDEGMESEVDEILRKIQEKGLDSLTRKERQVLEKAGQEYKRRRQ